MCSTALRSAALNWSRRSCVEIRVVVRIGLRFYILDAQPRHSCQHSDRLHVFCNCRFRAPSFSAHFQNLYMSFLFISAFSHRSGSRPLLPASMMTTLCSVASLVISTPNARLHEGCSRKLLQCTWTSLRNSIGQTHPMELSVL